MLDVRGRGTLSDVTGKGGIPDRIDDKSPLRYPEIKPELHAMGNQMPITPSGKTKEEVERKKEEERIRKEKRAEQERIEAEKREQEEKDRRIEEDAEALKNLTEDKERKPGGPAREVLREENGPRREEMNRIRTKGDFMVRVIPKRNGRPVGWSLGHDPPETEGAASKGAELDSIFQPPGFGRELPDRTSGRGHCHRPSRNSRRIQ